MAKKREELGDDLAPQIPLIKRKKLDDISKTEAVIKQVHEKEPRVVEQEQPIAEVVKKPRKRNKSKETIKHLNISFPLSIYKKVKLLALEEDTTFKQLVLEFVCEGLDMEKPVRRTRTGKEKI